MPFKKLMLSIHNEITNNSSVHQYNPFSLTQLSDFSFNLQHWARHTHTPAQRWIVQYIERLSTFYCKTYLSGVFESFHHTRMQSERKYLMQDISNWNRDDSPNQRNLIEWKRWQVSSNESFIFSINYAVSLFLEHRANWFSSNLHQENWVGGERPFDIIFANNCIINFSFVGSI